MTRFIASCSCHIFEPQTRLYDLKFKLNLLSDFLPHLPPRPFVFLEKIADNSNEVFLLEAGNFYSRVLTLTLYSEIGEGDWLDLENCEDTITHPEGGYDAVICIGNSFAHLPDFAGDNVSTEIVAEIRKRNT